MEKIFIRKDIIIIIIILFYFFIPRKYTFILLYYSCINSSLQLFIAYIYVVRFTTVLISK